MIAENCLNVFARGENNKGVVMYSMFDGSVVTNMTAMHTNYILQLLVTSDSKQVITCSKDKKIKIWDWIKGSLTTTLMRHEDSVESIKLSPDETILFSAGLDKKIILWSMLSHTELCTLQAELPIRTLTLTADNDYLVAETKPGEKDPR